MANAYRYKKYTVICGHFEKKKTKEYVALVAWHSGASRPSTEQKIPGSNPARV
jgi:hypothetical protein